jgi:hypothetical protein
MVPVFQHSSLIHITGIEIPAQTSQLCDFEKVTEVLYCLSWYVY